MSFRRAFLPEILDLIVKYLDNTSDLSNFSLANGTFNSHANRRLWTVCKLAFSMNLASLGEACQPIIRLPERALNIRVLVLAPGHTLIPSSSGTHTSFFATDNNMPNADEAVQSPKAISQALMEAFQMMLNVCELVLLGNKPKRIDAGSPEDIWWTAITETLSSWGATIALVGLYSSMPAFRVLPIIRVCPALQHVIITNQNLSTQSNPEAGEMLRLPKLTHLVGPASLVKHVAPASSLTNIGLSGHLYYPGAAAPLTLHTTISSLRAGFEITPFWNNYGLDPSTRITTFEGNSNMEEMDVRSDMIFETIRRTMWPFSFGPKKRDGLDELLESLRSSHVVLEEPPLGNWLDLEVMRLNFCVTEGQIRWDLGAWDDTRGGGSKADTNINHSKYQLQPLFNQIHAYINSEPLTMLALRYIMFTIWVITEKSPNGDVTSVFKVRSEATRLPPSMEWNMTVPSVEECCPRWGMSMHEHDQLCSFTAL